MRIKQIIKKIAIIPILALTGGITNEIIERLLYKISYKNNMIIYLMNVMSNMMLRDNYRKIYIGIIGISVADIYNRKMNYISMIENNSILTSSLVILNIIRVMNRCENQ
jgi:hypothetical protein